MSSWLDLYNLAGRVRKMAPWDWMDEIDIFGVQAHPGRDPFFISVMGAGGEHFAMAMYPDIGALSQLWALREVQYVEPEMVLEIPQTQLSFEDREYLQEDDRNLLKRLGLKFKGAKAWPQFRTYRGGFSPWLPSLEELEPFRVALEQSLEVAPRLQEHPELIHPEDPASYLVRTADPNGKWRDEFRKIQLTPIRRVRSMPDAGQVRRGRAMPKGEGRLEVDFFMIPTPVLTGKEHTFYPYVLLLVESKQGLVVGQQLLSVETTVDDMLHRVPEGLLAQFERIGNRPSTLVVRPGRMENLLRPWCESLGIKLMVHEHLQHLDEAKQGLIEFLSTGG
ncbi:MAG TPA: hypothetical protein VGK48_12650 [Terriglobia bacterium]|jgi:hypothetical protein